MDENTLPAMLAAVAESGIKIFRENGQEVMNAEMEEEIYRQIRQKGHLQTCANLEQPVRHRRVHYDKKG